ncbi:flagellar basal body rod protein FlgB, partial [Escherichia coli]|nr:flagellar basal body rod protein FlgB [Escherichia coli]
ILRGVRQQQDEPGRFSICSRQAAVVHGNTVDMDRERTQFADNSLQYQMSLSALSGQIKGMMNVLQSGN